MPEKKTTAGSSQKDIEENKLIAALSYVGLLCLVPLLMAKESKFAQFHAKQGLVLLIGWVAVAIIASIPLLGWVIGPILFLGMGIVSIFGIVMVLQGQEYRMPLVADLADKIDL